MTTTTEPSESLVLAGPEHRLVRQPTIDALVELGWTPEQMRWRPEWRVPLAPNEAAKREEGRSFRGYPVDLVLFADADSAGNWESVSVVFEFKRPDLSGGISQLETYLRLEPRAMLGYWTNGTSSIRVYRRADGTFYHVPGAKLPHPTENFALPPEKAFTHSDLRPEDAHGLRAVFERVLNVIVANDSVSTRPEGRLNEVCNVILTKLESDTIGRQRPESELNFQVRATESDTGSDIRQQFQRVRRRKPEVFSADRFDELRLDDHSLHQIAYHLAPIDLLDVQPEALSTAFQIFRNANLKAGDGQYFTPGPVLEAAIKMLEVGPDDRVIDPACGTGGFLSETFMQMTEVANAPLSLADARTWAHQNLHGIDRDEINVKLARAILMAMRDGSVHVHIGDSIRTQRWGIDYPHLALSSVNDGSFTVVVTNPPFGKDLKISAQDAQRNGYTMAEAAARKPGGSVELELGLVFIERAYRLLEPGGRLGIVLPETYFFSKSYEWLGSWLHDRFILRGVLNIPMEAFQGFCRAKTNFYVLEKKDVA